MPTNLTAHYGTGLAYAMGFTPADNSQTYNGMARDWDLGGIRLNTQNPIATKTPTTAAGWAQAGAGAGFWGGIGAASFVGSAAYGMWHHGALGAVGAVGTDMAINAAAARNVPTVTKVDGTISKVSGGGAARAIFGNSKLAAPARMGWQGMEELLPYVRPGVGSFVGGLGGSMLGPMAGYAGSIYGSHMMDADTRKIMHETIGAATSFGVKNAATGVRGAMRATGRLAARHPLAAFFVASAVVVNGGYYAAKVASPVGRVGMAGAQHFAGTVRQQMENKDRLDTAGDLAAFNTRRAVTAGQMAYRNRQQLGMNLRSAYSATATRYHHPQRVF